MSQIDLFENYVQKIKELHQNCVCVCVCTIYAIPYSLGIK